MAFGLKDIILSIKLRLDPSESSRVRTQVEESIGGGAEAGAARGGRAASEFEQSWSRVLNRVGALLFVTFGVRAIYNFVEESIMAFAKFDQKLQQSVAIMQNVDATMRQKLGDSARQVAKDLNLAAEDLAGSYYYLASAGLDAQQSIKALPVVATFAKAGLMDLANATQYLTEANAALGYKSKDANENMAGMARISDVLTLASKRSQATIEEFSQALTNKAGNSLRLFGKDVEEGVAALAVLANQGVKGAVAGERLDIFFRQATQAAEKHKEAFKAYGIQIFDTNGKMRDLADISDDLTKALGGLSDEQQVLAIQQLGFQTRTVAFVKQFIDQGDAIRQYEEALKSANGYTEEIANKQLQTPIEQWGLFKQKVIDVRREIGENFITTLGTLAEKMGNEDDPNSVVGVLKQFANWLKENGSLIEGMGTLVVGLVKGFMFFMDTMNIFADLIVVAVTTPVSALSIALGILGETTWSILKPIGLLIKWLSFDTIHVIDDLSNGIDKLSMKLLNFGADAGQVAINAGRDIFGLDDDKPGPKNNDITDGGDLSGNVSSSRTNDRDKTGHALDIPGKPKKAKATVDKLKLLEEDLTAFMAKHTATREDDQLASLARLEQRFKDYYGKKIPQHVKDSIALIKKAIADEAGEDKAQKQFDVLKAIGGTQGDVQKFIDQITSQRDSLDKTSVAWEKYNKLLIEANALMVQTKGRDVTDEYQDIGEIESIERKDQALHDFVDKMKRLKDQTSEGSKEWEIYRDALDKAQKALLALHKEIDKSEKKQAESEKHRKEEEHMRRIERIGSDTARNLASAFSSFFDVLLVGSKRGADAFEQMGRKIAASAIGTLSDYAAMKAKADFMDAADETFKGFAAMADPFMAWTAPMHFEAAGMAAAQGAAWAAIAGGAGGIAGAVGNSRHGMSAPSNASENSSSRVDNSTGGGGDINIFIDGVDPKNPRHQALIGQTVREYSARTGGTVNVNGKK